MTSTATSAGVRKRPHEEASRADDVLIIAGKPYRFPRRATAEEARRLGDASDVKLEYVGGTLYAMVGGSPALARIGANISGELRDALKETDCTVSNSDLKVASDARGHREVIYPDCVVVCGGDLLPADDWQAVTNPALIVEVLSPSTELRDRTEKFELVRNLASLREYVLVSQDRACVERFYHNGREWVFSATIGLDAAVTFESLAVTLPMSEIYLKIEFPPEEPVEETNGEQETPPPTP